MQLLVPALLAESFKLVSGATDRDIPAQLSDGAGFLDVLATADGDAVSGPIEGAVDAGLAPPVLVPVDEAKELTADQRFFQIVANEGMVSAESAEFSSMPVEDSKLLPVAEEPRARGTKPKDIGAEAPLAPEAIRIGEAFVAKGPISASQVYNSDVPTKPIQEKLPVPDHGRLDGGNSMHALVSGELHARGEVLVDEMQAGKPKQTVDPDSANPSSGPEKVYSANPHVAGIHLSPLTAVPPTKALDKERPDINVISGLASTDTTTSRQLERQLTHVPNAAVVASVESKPAEVQPMVHRPKDEGVPISAWRSVSKLAETDEVQQPRALLPNRSELTSTSFAVATVTGLPGSEKPKTAVGVAANGAMEQLVAEPQMQRPEEAAKTAAAETTRSEPVAARSIINQVIQSVTRTQAEGVFEIRLQPEELGRVRLTIAPSEAGVSVQVAAERSETLELLRRNIDLLENELKERGFSDMNFSFGSDGSDDGGFVTSERNTDEIAEEAAVEGLTVELAMPNVSPGNGSLDIRV